MASTFCNAGQSSCPWCVSTSPFSEVLSVVVDAEVKKEQRRSLFGVNGEVRSKKI